MPVLVGAVHNVQVLVPWLKNLTNKIVQYEVDKSNIRP